MCGEIKLDEVNWDQGDHERVSTPVRDLRLLSCKTVLRIVVFIYKAVFQAIQNILKYLARLKQNLTMDLAEWMLLVDFYENGIGRFAWG